MNWFLFGDNDDTFDGDDFGRGLRGDFFVYVGMFGERVIGAHAAGGLA